MSESLNTEVKSLTLSFSGLKNVVLIGNDHNSHLTIDDDFRFIFGKKEIKMNRFFADFISPRVSFIHYSDITIDYIDLSNMVNMIHLLDKQFNPTELFNYENSSLFLQLSTGHEIKINEKTNKAFRLISILIGNEELYQKTCELFPIFNENEDIDELVKYLLALRDVSSLFYDENIISYLSKNFYSIKNDKLLKLPKNVLYSIISNKNLRLENEDSLIDFISNIFENDDDMNDDPINSISFLEQVDFTSLSKEKLIEVIELIEPNNITKSLWGKFFNCFNFNQNDNSPERSNQERYISIENPKKLHIIQIPYDFDQSHRFDGIVSFLRKNNDDNFEYELEITASSYRSERSNPKNAADFLNEDNYFGSKNRENSWLCYNFKNRKVRPNYYSIKSWGSPKGNHHLKNWEIQASNNGVEWKVIDSKAIETSLDGPNNSSTFEIRNLKNSAEFYQYLRIVQTGLNSGAELYLNIQCLEFFGDILDE